MANTVETATPFSDSQLQQIAEDACAKAFGDATEYDHKQTEAWNGAIINNILGALVTPADSQEQQPAPRYKYAVTSTIIQHIAPSSGGGSGGVGTTSDAGTSTSGGGGVNGDQQVGVKPQPGRRGMHSATGAYWNGATDGMWSFKWGQGERRGCDVVVSVLWIQA